MHFPLSRRSRPSATGRVPLAEFVRIPSAQIIPVHDVDAPTEVIRLESQDQILTQPIQTSLPRGAAAEIYELCRLGKIAALIPKRT